MFLDDDTTYDIVDDRGTITIADDLKDFITVTRYNEIEERTETTRNVTSVTFTTTPLYRYYNPTTGDHFTGLDSIPPEGYDNEGILDNVFVGPQPPGTVPLIDDEEGNRSNAGKPLSSYTAYVFLAMEIVHLRLMVERYQPHCCTQRLTIVMYCLQVM